MTGARKGVGARICQHLLDQGAETVVGVSRGTSSFRHDRYVHVQADVSSDADVRAIPAQLPISKLDLLINNAGVTASGVSAHSQLLSEDAAKGMLMTNLLGPFLVTRTLVPLLRRSGAGRVISIGSMAAPLEPIGEAIYATTKAGLTTLTAVLAKENARYGITCNTLGITAIETEMAQSKDKDALDRVIASLPLGRYAEWDDIFNVIDFFADERSTAITAQTVYLGGLHA